MNRYFTRSFFTIVWLLIVMGCFSQNITEKKFHTEEITFTNGKIKLAATIFIPSATGKHPAIAVTHGSGKDSKSHEGFISLASILANEGFLVLIYDKRGVGNSTGTYEETPDMSVPAGDLINAVRYLESRKDVDAEKIGVYGHSQGGWVAPLAAAISKNISFVIVACGGAISIREQDLYNSRADMRKKNFTGPEIDSAVIFGRQFFTYLASGLGYGIFNPVYERAVRQNWFVFFKDMGFRDQLPPPSMLKDKRFNFFKSINYDPQAALRSLDIPTFVMLGEKDETVPSEKCKQAWEDAYYASDNSKQLSVIILPGENHYDFERAESVVRYKSSFAVPLIGWLKEKIK